MLQKIIRGVSFDITNVHICFRDSSRDMCAGARLGSIAVYSTDSSWVRLDDSSNLEGGSPPPVDALHKASSMQSLSIYYGTYKQTTSQDHGQQDQGDPADQGDRAQQSQGYRAQQGDRAIAIAYSHFASQVIDSLSGGGPKTAFCLPIGSDPKTHILEKDPNQVSERERRISLPDCIDRSSSGELSIYFTPTQYVSKNPTIQSG